MATNCPKPIEVTVGFVAGANWDLVHLRTSVRAGPQTRLWSLSSVTGNPLKLGICASRPLGLLSTRVSSPAQNPQMHQNLPVAICSNRTRFANAAAARSADTASVPASPSETSLSPVHPTPTVE